MITIGFQEILELRKVQAFVKKLVWFEYLRRHTVVGPLS